jgi:hypothetical protein
MPTKTLEIRVDEAVSTLRASRSLVEALTSFRDSDGDKLRILAENLGEFIDALDAAANSGQDWADAEGGDKRDAREVFLDDLDTLNEVSPICDPEALAIYCDEHAADWTKDAS